MLSIYRLVQFAALHTMMAKDSGASVPTAFVKGLWFDNVVACYVMVVPLAVLLLAACGIATMWLAVFADVGVTVLAVLNAMRALSTPTANRTRN